MPSKAFSKRHPESVDMVPFGVYLMLSLLQVRPGQ